MNNDSPKNTSTRVLIALGAGLLIGILIDVSGSTSLREAVGIVEPIGTLWTNAIRMTVIPLVLALIITGVAGERSAASVGRIGKKVVPIFVGLLLAGAALALALSPPAMSGLEIPAQAAQTLRDSASTNPNASPPTMPTVAQRIVDIVPTNPIRAAADAAMLPLVFFALLFALAVLRIDRDKRTAVVGFFQALGDAMMVLVRWVLVVAPIGIFALALGIGTRMGTAAAGALLHYVVVLCGVLILFTLLLYPFVLLVARVPIKQFAAAASEAQGIAISSRSSLAALPAIVNGARTHLKSPASVTGFALPLAVSVFRVNVPMAWIVGVLFLGKLYDVPIDTIDLLQVAALSSFLSFSVPGIPSASLFMLAPVLEGMGIPAAGAAILIGVDAIPDMFKTTVNVTSHVAVAAVLGRTETDEPEPSAPSTAGKVKAA
jgi:Na+/H+-dicarboxylate symporter